jgi:hypothetical protein
MLKSGWLYWLPFLRDSPVVSLQTINMSVTEPNISLRTCFRNPYDIENHVTATFRKQGLRDVWLCSEDEVLKT